MLKKHLFIYQCWNRGKVIIVSGVFYISLMQANRTQSLNYGCIVETMRQMRYYSINMTRLASLYNKFIWFEGQAFSIMPLRRFLLSLYSNITHLLSGASFCGETPVLYKWHYQLWDLFVHTRYFWPYWDGFPEEPTREDPVSVTDIIQPLNRFAAFTGQIYVYRCISLNHVVEKFICFSNSTQIVKLVY